MVGLSRPALTRSVMFLLKYYPIVFHIFIVIDILEQFELLKITSWIYPILGSSVIINVILFLLSILFKFSNWHRILIINMFVTIILEWIDVNFSGVFNTTDFLVYYLVVSILFIMVVQIKKLIKRKQHYDDKC